MSTPKDRDAEALDWVHRGWEHLRAQRPLAAWGAWQRALLIEPDQQAAGQALAILAAADDFPPVARGPYRFRSPREEVGRTRWDAAFRGRATGDLQVAAAVFGELAQADPHDAPASFNQALCLAWAGSNVEAIQCLGLALRADADANPEAAIEAATLAEILRQGAGAEVLADDLTHTLTLPWSPPGKDPIHWLASFALLRELELPLDPDAPEPSDGHPRAFEWLDRPMPSPSANLAADDLPRVLAGVVATRTSLAFTSPDPDSLRQVEGLLRNASPTALEGADRRSAPLPIRLIDAAAFRFRLPEGLDEPSRRRLVREALESYFENRWIAIERRSLAGLVGSDSPLATPRSLELGTRDPSAEAIARAALEGVIRVREQLGRRRNFAPLYGGYPFDRLRHRLGFELTEPGTVDPADLTCLSALELAKLDPSSLDDAGLIDAFRSAAWIDPATAARLATAALAREPETRADGLGKAIAETARREPDHARAWIACALEPNLAGQDTPTHPFFEQLLAEFPEPISPGATGRE